MLRILLVDDHAVVRKGLIQILRNEFPDGVFGEAGDARAALSGLRKSRWDLAVLDIDLPGRSGLDLMSDMRHSRPNLPVLVLSIHPEDQLAVRTLRAGARGYLSKETAPEELINAVKKVMDGGKYVSPTLAELLAGELQRPAKTLPHTTLSDREFEILRRIAAGMTIKEIAAQLSLSAKTIHTYRERVLKKMKMRNSAELIRYAMQQKLVD